MTDINKENAKKASSQISSEIMALNPSALITLFEIDLSSVEKKIGDGQSSLIGEYIVRFHNNKEFPKKTITWQSKHFSPAPIIAEGFDTSSRGVLPTPKMSVFVNNNESEMHSFSLLRRISKEYGDIVGAKVTRIRTFLKYLDLENFEDEESVKSGLFSLPQDYEPNKYAELPRDIFYIERKTNETPTEMSFELSSLIDVEGIKLPRRTINSLKCSFNYRGCGCFYEYDNHGEKLKEVCETEGMQLPIKAPPVADGNNISIDSSIGEGNLKEPFDYFEEKTPRWSIGATVYVNKNGINYYYVLKTLPPEGEKPPPPPNSKYWIADACAKTLFACRQRWGINGAVTLKQDDTTFKKGELQFGGFPNATRINQYS